MNRQELLRSARVWQGPQDDDDPTALDVAQMADFGLIEDCDCEECSEE